MGTRNLTMVISNKETKVAQYGQWDGYPRGQGATIVKFLRKANLKEFKKKLANSKFLTQAEVDKKLAEIGVTDGWMNMEQSKQWNDKYPQLSRDTGAKVLTHILKSKDTIELYDNSEFGTDGIFCEWSYIVDMDKKVLKVFNGTLGGKPVKTYKFAELPTPAKFAKQINKILEKEEA